MKRRKNGGKVTVTVTRVPAVDRQDRLRRIFDILGRPARKEGHRSDTP